jgi:hypothetical protein
MAVVVGLKGISASPPAQACGPASAEYAKELYQG